MSGAKISDKGEFGSGGSELLLPALSVAEGAPFFFL